MSPHLASSELVKFHEEAQQVAHAINVDNVVLSDLSG
jgi:hypothetical protein